MNSCHIADLSIPHSFSNFKDSPYCPIKKAKEARSQGMSYGTAIYIIENLDKHTDEEIALAIYKILNMTTIMAVKKDSLLNVVRYLFNKCYEVEEIKGGDK
jgi:hypothetical protein